MEIPSRLHSWTIYPVWFCEWKLRALIHWNAISTFEGIFVNYNRIFVNYTTIFEWLFSLFSQCFQNYLPTYLLQYWAQWQLKGNSFSVCVFVLFSDTWFLYVRILTLLERTLYTRMASNSQRFACCAQWKFFTNILLLKDLCLKESSHLNLNITTGYVYRIYVWISSSTKEN